MCTGSVFGNINSIHIGIDIDSQLINFKHTFICILSTSIIYKRRSNILPHFTTMYYVVYMMTNETN